MALQVTAVAAHAPAVDHVVTGQIAAVAVGATLVAVGAAAAFAEATLHAAALPGMASGGAEKGEKNGEELDVFHKHEARILTTSRAK